MCAIEKSNSQYGNYGTQDSAAFDLEEFGDGRADTLTITYTYSNPSRYAMSLLYYHFFHVLDVSYKAS